MFVCWAIQMFLCTIIALEISATEDLSFAINALGFDATEN